MPEKRTSLRSGVKWCLNCGRTWSSFDDLQESSCTQCGRKIDPDDPNTYGGGRIKAARTYGGGRVKAAPTEYIKCLSCGYILNFLPAHRCPECGRAFDPDNALTFAGGSRENEARPTDIGSTFIAVAFLVPILNTIAVMCVPPWRIVQIDPWTLKWWVVRATFLVQLAVFVVPLVVLIRAKVVYSPWRLVFAAALGLMGLAGCGLVQRMLTGPPIIGFG